MTNDYRRPITGSLAALAKRLERELALAGAPGEYVEAGSWELIRLRAEERDRDRKRPGDQHLLGAIIATAEMKREAALDHARMDRQDLAHHGYLTERLWSVDENSEEAYAAIPSGQWFRLDGELRQKP